MKTMSSNGTYFLLVLLAAIACSNQDTGVIRKVAPASEKENSQSGNPEDDPNKDLNVEKIEASGSGLFLSWTKPTAPVLSYRIYSNGGTDLSTGGELLRTVTAPAGKEIPVEIELTKEEAAKAQAGRLCLYMIAANGSLSSEPSATACLGI
jgi:hypothetical protein